MRLPCVVLVQPHDIMGNIVDGAAIAPFFPPSNDVLFYWDEVLTAKKRHTIIFFVLWVLIFLSFLLDRMWK